MSWTLSDIDKLKTTGKIRDYRIMSKSFQKQQENCTKCKLIDAKRQKVAKEVPKALREIMNWLAQMDITFETEYKFLPDRKFRFDIAIIQLKVAIEYEGLMSKKSRHTTVTGYTRDATKYNLAQAAGWRVFRYTALNYKQAANDLKNIINQVK